MMPELISTNDHDLLITLHTKMDVMISSLEVIRSLENASTRHSEKIKAIEAKQADDHKETLDEIKSLKSRDLFQTLALLIGTILAGVIAWFKH
jgi:hypothetical protein